MVIRGQINSRAKDSALLTLSTRQFAGRSTTRQRATTTEPFTVGTCVRAALGARSCSMWKSTQFGAAVGYSRLLRPHVDSRDGRGRGSDYLPWQHLEALRNVAEG
jgi:hypothetical protein